MRSSPRIFLQQISLQYNYLDTGKMYCVVHVTVLFWHSVYVCVCVCAVGAQSYLTLWTPWTVALQAPLSMGFPRQEYWSGLPFLSPEDPPHPGIEPTPPVSPALQAYFFFYCSAIGEVLDRILYFFLSFWMMGVLIYYGRIIWICLWAFWRQGKYSGEKNSIFPEFYRLPWTML